MEVIFFNGVYYCLWFPLDVRHCFKMSSLKFHFQFGKWSEITSGYVWWVGRMGNDNHVVVSHKPCGFQGRVGGRIVMKKPVVVAPKFRSFLLHIFSQASQNITIKVGVTIVLGGTNARWTIPFTSKKITVNPTSVTRYPRGMSKSWVLVSLLL
jgi:hypothetical protein